MINQNIKAGTEYPSHTVDPVKKGYEWMLQYVRAANAEGQSYMPALQGNLYYRRLEEIRSYGLGKQTINKYKRRQAGDAIDDNTEVNNDYSVVPVICKFREIIIARLMQRAYDIQAFAVDPLSKSQEDEVFNQMKVKVIMRDVAKKLNSPLQDSPMLKKQSGEPEDMEELDMQREYGYKDNMCMEAEEGIQLIQQQNMIDERRKRTIENFVDYGLGGYHQWIDENGKVKISEIPIKNLLTSFCTKNDFSDMVHWGIYEEVNLIDLAPYFTNEQMDKIQQNVAGKNNNPRMMYGFTRAWAKYKVCVLNFKFLTWNTTVYKKEIDNRGNGRFRETHYENLQFVNNEDKGEAYPKYMSSTKQCMYKCKWIVDTDMMYDYGESENQIRKKSSWWDTSLDCQLYAWNFDNMLFSGITERLIPIADAYYLTWMKLQNLKNKLIPYLIELDLNAIESATFGAGGEKMTREEIVDFAFSNFIVMTRSTDLITKNPNYKAMQIHASGQLQAFVHLYQDLQFCVQQLYDITGLNQITAASTPNPKTLVPGYENANIGTDNAIYLLGLADKNLMLRMSDNIFCKIQVALKLGKVEGYVKALGSQTVKFLSINPDLSLIEMGIFLEDMPTYEERQALYMDLTTRESQGLIEPQDKYRIMEFKTLKRAHRYLAYVVKKRKEQMQAFELQKIQQQVQGNAQVAASAEQMKQQTIMLQGKIDLEKINQEMQWTFIIEKMKKGSDQEEAGIQGQAKIIAQQIQGQSKILSQHIAAEAQKESASKRSA